MNWMIDGLYGDHYRVAMGYPPLTPHNETLEHRTSGTSPVRNVRRALLASGAHLALVLGIWSGVLPRDVPSGEDRHETP